jgi:GAF domain-containing protein
MTAASSADIRRDVADALSVTAGYAETIERVAALAVTLLAQLCFIDLSEAGVLTRRALVVDPILGTQPAFMQAPHPDVGEGAAAALRGQTTLIYRRGWFAALGNADPALAPFLDGALQTVLVLPMMFDRRPLGILTLGQLADAGDVDLDLATDFARLAAMAIANARLHEDSRRATALADASRVRLSFVSRASAIFARSFDRAATLGRFATTTVHDFADGVYVLIAPPGGREEHYSAGVIASDLARALAEHAMLDARSRLDDGERALATPLLSGGHVSGALTFVRSREQPPFVIDDLTLVEELAARTALYVEAAQRYTHQRRVADTLQQAFRPRDLPRVPGLEISAAYRPCTTDMDVGGDWYDVVIMDDKRVAFAIGDVMGHGVEAAAVMAEIRSGLRAHLYAQSDPGRCLGYVDTLLANAKDREMFATGAVAFYDRARHQLTIANAGHPMPYVRRAGGSVEALGRSTTLLGLDSGPRIETTHDLAAGDIVLFYTDGVVEDRALPIDDGLALLEAALTRSSEPGAIIDDLLGISDASTDDRTLLVFRVL